MRYVLEYIYQVHDYELHASYNIKEVVTSSFVDCFSRFARFVAGFDSVLVFYSAGKMADIDSPYCTSIGHRPFLRLLFFRLLLNHSGQAGNEMFRLF